MTALAADNLGIERRGLLKPGYFADLVLFDPAAVADRSTVENPRALSVGIDGVWVNGVQVYVNGQATGARPGAILRHQSGPAWR